ncbi:hypothetical protein [Aurantiacibacter flavus]|uniref:Uncharacterized protein n=1 Tax=Aurantiacibacter flavus TaxID=3145232 RepID=A0ABV0CZ28_9SPHN
MSDFVLSLVMLAAAVLVGGAYSLFRKGNTQKALLMAMLAFVMIANVVIWVVPANDGGESLQEAAAVED